MNYEVYQPTKTLPNCQQLRFPEDYQLVGRIQATDPASAFMLAQAQGLPAVPGSVFGSPEAVHRCTRVHWTLLPRDIDRLARVHPVCWERLPLPADPVPVPVG